MKHFLTILLILITTGLFAQTDETDLIGESMNQVIQVNGYYDNYGFSDNGDPYIKYNNEDGFGGTLFYFNEYGLCDRIYIVMARKMEYSARSFLNQNFLRVENNRWSDVYDDVHLYLINFNIKIVIRIAKY